MDVHYPDGGYAFPEGEMQHRTPHGYQRQLGMTLRDYIAIQAMAAMITTCALPTTVGGLKGAEPNCAASAYKMADAMLEERDQ